MNYIKTGAEDLSAETPLRPRATQHRHHVIYQGFSKHNQPRLFFHCLQFIALRPRTVTVGANHFAQLLNYQIGASAVTFAPPDSESLFRPRPEKALRPPCPSRLLPPLRHSPSSVSYCSKLFSILTSPSSDNCDLQVLQSRRKSVKIFKSLMLIDANSVRRASH